MVKLYVTYILPQKYMLKIKKSNFKSLRSQSVFVKLMRGNCRVAHGK